MKDTRNLINQTMCEKPQIRLIDGNNKTNEKYEEEWAKMENESFYSGTVERGMPNGFGKEYGISFLYTGYFIDGKWHGQGLITQTIPEYKEINGEFIDGYFCGI